MSDHEYQEPGRRPRKNKSRLPLLVVVLLFAAAGAATFLYLRHRQTDLPGSSGKPEVQPSRPPAAVVQPAPTAAERETALGLPPPAAEVEVPAPASPPAGGQSGQCAVLARKLHEFFRHVDQQDYLARFSLEGPSQSHFISLAERLLANPPVVTRETDDLYTILQNTAHFFRIIGKDNILLIKTILDRERDSIEDVAAEIYQWLTTEGCQEELLPFSPPLAQVYEYAGFFLNTMGGRSYLFRRDSRSRLLVNYYSILIIDQANGLGINRHGIDISQPVGQLIQEIESSTQLRDRDGYLDRLYRLQDTLPAPMRVPE